MFVARDRENNARLTSLDPVWASRLDELRALAFSGRLVCPGCEQALRFRSGAERRPHFAHRVLSECPLARQSAEVLEAKAQLYQWLITKYPDKVELDVDLHIADWDRFADLAVRPEVSKTFAYWLFDRTPRNRAALLYGMPEGITGHVLYTASAQKRDAEDNLLLAAGQRDFIGHSGFDERLNRGHLHFVDVDRHFVVLYRGLRCVHEPNVYTCQVVHELPWDQCRICPQSGEVVADGERSLAARYTDSPTEHREATEQTVCESGNSNTVRYGSSRPSVEVSDHARYRFDPSLRQDFRHGTDAAWLNRSLKCERCGKETADYSVSTPNAGTCICRDCHPAHLAERLRGTNQD